ncbi:MAG: ATP-binding cassette domain-containing protein [Caldilineaceae bacterium]
MAINTTLSQPIDSPVDAAPAEPGQSRRSAQATSTGILVDARDLFKFYRERQVETAALRGVDLQMRAGEFVTLVGPSGSGKSTLLNLIGGLDTPSFGQVSVAGHDLAQAPESQRALLRRQTVGFVFQQHNLIPFLSAHQNVQMPLQLAQRTDAATRSQRSWIKSAWPTAPIICPPRSLAANSSESALLAPWPTNRRCCWPMNPPANWTARPPTPLWNSLSASTGKTASPSSW